AVLAARLSEDPGTRVLLVEAGRDTPPGAVPADIADTFPASSLNADYFWPGLQAVRSPGRPPQPFPQARVMGGGSSVMGLWALRGVPSDFDAWVAADAARRMARFRRRDRRRRGGARPRVQRRYQRAAGRELFCDAAQPGHDGARLKRQRLFERHRSPPCQPEDHGRRPRD